MSGGKGEGSRTTPPPHPLLIRRSLIYTRLYSHRPRRTQPITYALLTNVPLTPPGSRLPIFSSFLPRLLCLSFVSSIVQAVDGELSPRSTIGASQRFRPQRRQGNGLMLCSRRRREVKLRAAWCEKASGDPHFGMMYTHTHWVWVS